MGSEPSASPSCVYDLQCGLVLMLRTTPLEGTDVQARAAGNDRVPCIGSETGAATSALCGAAGCQDTDARAGMSALTQWTTRGAAAATALGPGWGATGSSR